MYCTYCFHVPVGFLGGLQLLTATVLPPRQTDACLHGRYCLWFLLPDSSIACSYCVQCSDLDTTPLDVYLVEMLYLRFEYAVLSGFHGICIYIYLGVNLVYMYHMEIMYILTAVLLFAVLFFYWSSYYRWYHLHFFCCYTVMLLTVCL